MIKSLNVNIETEGLISGSEFHNCGPRALRLLSPYFAVFRLYAKYDMQLVIYDWWVLGHFKPKNHTRKIDKIHKDFELYQVFIHNLRSQNVPIPQLYTTDAY